MKTEEMDVKTVSTLEGGDSMTGQQLISVQNPNENQKLIMVTFGKLVFIFSIMNCSTSYHGLS